MTGRVEKAIFEIKNLRHRYDGRTVLDIPDLAFEGKKIYALVGPNGSGKTTLLLILNLLLNPTEGGIIYGGERAGQGEEARRRQRLSMSLLLQDPYLFNTTVAGNVAWGLKARKVGSEEIENRVQAALSLVGIKELQERRARTLSGGEAQRTALARALVLSPDVLLLDEPTANIDPQSTAELERAIKKINVDKKVTVIMTTHNLDQAYRLADEVFTLIQGRLIPSPMDNLFSGKTVRREKGCFFETSRLSFEVVLEGETGGIGHAMIHPEDIVVSRKPFTSSARNVLEGRVRSIAEEGGLVRLKVEAGEVFTVSVTGASCRELGIGLGTQVYLTFKASAIHLI